MFCRYYTQSGDNCGNATLSYAAAFDYELDSLSKINEWNETDREIQGTCLDFEGITQADVAQLATAYNTLINAAAMTAQDADEDQFRELMSLPELDQKGVREKEVTPTDPNDPNFDKKKKKEEASEHRHSVKKVRRYV